MKCGRTGGRFRWVRIVGGALLITATVSPRAEASNEALLKLLAVLRDRGSITSADYDDLRRAAESESSAPAQAPAPLPVAQAPAVGSQVEDIVPPLVNKALAGKWYEKIGLRGYTQFRYTATETASGPAVEVPADRSVSPNESFMVRRGRFIFSGDPTERLALYAQLDFNASTGAADFSLQMRDLYADVAFDANKAWRVRFGQSKVPYGWVNLQSSQNRGPLERPDALNSGVEGERDLGATLMWAAPEARRRFRDLVGLGLKGSGDYGVVAVGAYSGQGLNRSDQNGNVHLIGRVSYPFKLRSDQYVELGVQAYHGRFVSPVQAIPVGGAIVTPSQRPDGERDDRVAATVVWYPQPVGFEAEWTFGHGPALSHDGRSIERRSLHGGYLQLSYRYRGAHGTWFPFTRWNYFDGARKFARNAPISHVNEVDFGLEFARWAELETTAMYTHTFGRTRTSSFPYALSTRGRRVGLQVQWNY
jgi:hypothetical protein